MCLRLLTIERPSNGPIFLGRDSVKSGGGGGDKGNSFISRSEEDIESGSVGGGKDGVGIDSVSVGGSEDGEGGGGGEEAGIEEIR